MLPRQAGAAAEPWAQQATECVALLRRCATTLDHRSTETSVPARLQVKHAINAHAHHVSRGEAAGLRHWVWLLLLVQVVLLLLQVLLLLVVQVVLLLLLLLVLLLLLMMGRVVSVHVSSSPRLCLLVCIEMLMGQLPGVL